MVSKKAIVLIPGFRSGLYNFFLNSLQQKEYGFQSYGEIENKDNLIIRQVNLDQCLLHIYELDYLEGISDVNLIEWINLLPSICQFFYWLTPGYDWLTKFRCSHNSYFQPNKINSRSQKPHKQKVGCNSLVKETLCKLNAYKNSFNGYPLILTLSYIVFYLISVFYLFLVLANSFESSSIEFLKVISSYVTTHINAGVRTFAGYFCSGNSQNEINICVANNTLVLAWISVLMWILSAWFFIWIRFLLGKVKFAQNYLENEFLRIEIRNEILKVLNTVINDYTEVTIISHSFGVLVGADSIAHALTSSNKNIKFISLGNSLYFLAINKYNLIKSIVTKCIQKLREINDNDGQLWIDYRANFDSLSTQIDKNLFGDSDKDLNFWDSVVKEEQVMHKDFDFSSSWDSESDSILNSVKKRYKISNFLKRIRNCFKQYLGVYHLVYFQEDSYIKGSDENMSVIKNILKNQIQV